MTLRHYAFSRKRRAQFSEDAHAFVLHLYHGVTSLCNFVALKILIDTSKMYTPFLIGLN